MSKLNILVVTPYPLFPANRGGRIHVVSLLKAVKDEVNLHLLATMKREEMDELANNRSQLLAEYYSLFRSVHFVPSPKIPGEMGSKKNIIAHLIEHTWFGLPLMQVSFYDRDIVKTARQIVRQQHIDVIEVHHLHMAFIKKFIPQVPAILIDHNREHELWYFNRREDRSLGRAIWNYFGRISNRNGSRIEVDNQWKFAGRGYISLSDMAASQNQYGKPYWLPTAIESNITEKIFNEGVLKVMWVGGFDWFPNREGAIWFAEEVWPILQKKSERFEFHFIGSHPPEELQALHDGKNIFVHGFVEDICEYWDTSDAFIVPLHHGGGIRIKIIEALNAGIPIVTTTKGCEGLPCEPGIDLLIADEPEDFVKKLCLLADDPSLRQRLSHQGREYIRQYHSFSAVGTKKMEIYHQAARK